MFGSVARDEATPASDVDILVEFEPPVTFDRYMDVKFYLEDHLGRKVDLVSWKSLKPQIRASVEQEAIHVGLGARLSSKKYLQNSETLKCYT